MLRAADLFGLLLSEQVKGNQMSSSSSASLLDVDLQPGRPPMLRAEATGDAPGWAAEHRDALRAVVAEHGSVLVRGLGLRDAAEVGAVFRRLATGLMTEREAFAPRRTYSDGVYSSSKWPPNQPMCMHHELSYTLEFPGLMLFACLGAPTEGGATAVADSPTVLDALPAELIERFEREGWMLTRSYNDEIGASVAEAFGTDDRGAVESYCRANAIEFEWQPDGGLRTRQRRSAVVRHPVTGQRCWFNQIAFLNEWTIGPGGARVPRRRLRRGRAAVQHPLRQRRPDRRGRRAAAQRGLRGQHRARAVAGRRPDAGRQHPHRAQQGGLRGTARGAGRDGRRRCVWPTARRPSR